MTVPFDISGPLPTGVTVLEASAGTGKTFTIAALAARYVAEGFELDKLLLVTFTRMATGELRERVRERLVQAEHALATGEAKDDVDRLLLSGPDVALRRERLAAALADFDSATVATTHEFCGEMLGGLGVAGDVEPDATFLEDISDLIEEVVDDLYVRRFHRHGMPQFTRAQAMEIARAAIENPAAPIEPADAPPETVEAMRVRLAEAARKELDQRKRRMAVMTFDDLLTRLDGTLSSSDEAVERLRDRYRVVLVDEFQDTDPVQWSILERAFGAGSGVTLVLIGDPKQAIYAFRGADVFAYIKAAETAGEQRTLNVNWRSDQALLDAYDALFAGAALGHEGIVYRQVKARHPEPRLHGAPDSTPLRVRIVPRGVSGTTRGSYAKLNPAREHIARDLADDVVRLLRSKARIPRGPICPGDIAVLVRTNRTAARVRDALAAVDVPAVINGAGSVFATDPAREWLRLLEAIERPAHPGRAKSAALTTFLGWTTERAAAADEDGWEEVHRRLHHWARVLRAKGVASLMETITLEERLPGRVLTMPDGERRMTDLRHIGELLHAAATTEQLGATALTGWLRMRVEQAASELGDEERSRRLESDAEAVQVLTVHRAKGLEFPVVYYPDLFEPSPTPRDDRRAPVVFHDDDNVRTIDVGLAGPQWTGHVRRHTEEQRGEDLRLAYVALTRARHQAVVWWAGSFDTRHSALTRLIWFRDGGLVSPSGGFTPTDAEAYERFSALAGVAPVSVAWSEHGDGSCWEGLPPASGELSASSFDRTLDWWWRRTSYSDITAGTYEARVASEPEEPVVEDETAPPSTAAGGEVPLAAMPAGVEVGTLVHRAFETVDFAADDLPAALAEQTGFGEDVVDGLRLALETPLPIGLRLRDVRREDRLDELTFELPLVGGDVPDGGALTMDAIAAVLRRHPGGALDGYADRLGDPRLREHVRGYLTGSIDLVVRTGGRFAIVDYKTNWLAPPGEPLTAWHHRQEALHEEMLHSHYGLQALLYAVALHRYLRWRLPGYSPSEHLAGVLYLFIRGMTADGTDAGIFHWRPPAELVCDLSDVLDRGGGVIEADDVRLARGAEGLLATFNEAGVLAAADVHVARRLCALAGEEAAEVLLAAALAVRAPRLGHVFVDLARIATTATVDSDEPVDVAALPWPSPEPWAAAVAASPLCGGPLRLEGTALYLDRYWREEQQVADDLRAHMVAIPDVSTEGIERHFAGAEPDPLQRQAVATALQRRLAILAGGPGTGKTTTVARIVALLLEQNPGALIALAAPTGKAAARLQESLHDVTGLGLQASTLHRLLGWRPGSHSRFRHHRGNRLPHDVVIVDETSMVSLTLMARLVEAVRPEARLILVGDPGQLTSIEAGAVLGDIVGLPEGVVVLEQNHRFRGAIARLAEAIRDGDAARALHELREGEEITWVEDDPGELDSIPEVRAGAVATGRAVIAAARAGDALAALDALGTFRVLCAHRRGPHGVATWMPRIESWLDVPAEPWYVGRPLLVTENDHAVRLYNGDTGVVVQGANGRPAAAFERQGELVSFSPSRLAAVQTVYAMTVHKAQGSQFDTAAVLLPDPSSPILTRELLYTAVTRARTRLVLVGTEAAVSAAVERPIARASGLRDRLR